MNGFTLELKETYQKPLINLADWHGYYALLDTGALFPVWTADEKILPKLGAQFIKADVPFSGFGGETAGNLYRLKEFRLGNLVFPDMPVVTSKEMASEPYHIILSATMMQNLIYTIDDKHHKLTVEIPEDESLERHMRIYDKAGRLYVLCGNGENKGASED